MANKDKISISLDKDVRRAVDKESTKKRTNPSALINKTMAEKLKVKL